MKVAILVVTLIALASASPSLKKQWSSFKAQYGKSYDSETEEQHRLSVFSDNLKTIEEHNVKHKAGLVSYYLKQNQFSDLTTEEFSALMNGLNNIGQLVNHKVTGLPYQPPEKVNLPESIDWRTKGAVTPVKKQGLCGACWAFSATGSLEGQLFKKIGKLVSLSEQQLIDCSRDFKNLGCKGGLMVDAYEYLKHAGGIMSEESYPYKEMDDTCNFQIQEAVNGSAVKSFVELPEGDVKALETAVATVGPISTGISAGNAGFHQYGGGIFDGKECGRIMITHGVVIVGYGSESGKDYWIVKNSWSKYWGEEGYMRLAKTNNENACGIASMASYPVF